MQKINQSKQETQRLDSQQLTEEFKFIKLSFQLLKQSAIKNKWSLNRLIFINTANPGMKK